MGRPTLAESKDTKAELFQIGMEMIQTRGYHAFSYQDLSDRLKINKASIHYHFPTKEDFGSQIVDRSCARFQAWKENMADQDLSPTTLLDSYFDYFAKISENSRRICPCGALASEWETLPKKLQASVLKLLGAHRDWLKGVLERGRKLGEFRKLGTVEEQAQFIFASVQGALQTSRAQGSPGYYRGITRQILGSILT